MTDRKHEVYVCNDVTELCVRSWSAHATMINRAQDLERVAAELRRVADILHKALDPKVKP